MVVGAWVVIDGQLSTRALSEEALKQRMLNTRVPDPDTIDVDIPEPQAEVETAALVHWSSCANAACNS
jgi:hypothetical protein